MIWADGEIRWSPRVDKWKIARAYGNDAAGLADEALLDDIGTALYMRCTDILYIHEALGQRWHCPRCESETGVGPLLVPFMQGSEDMQPALYQCPACRLAIEWEQFYGTFRRRQMNPGGAVSAFRRFVDSWPRCRDGGWKFAAIDRLIHAFHYSYRAMPHLPTRTAAVNLLEGKLSDIMPFLDELSEGRMDPVTQTYRREILRMKEAYLTGIKANKDE